MALNDDSLPSRNLWEVAVVNGISTPLTEVLCLEGSRERQLCSIKPTFTYAVYNWLLIPINKIIKEKRMAQLKGNTSRIKAKCLKVHKEDTR